MLSAAPRASLLRYLRALPTIRVHPELDGRTLDIVHSLNSSFLHINALRDLFLCDTSLWFCPRRERGTPLYVLYRYVQPHRVWYFKTSLCTAGCTQAILRHFGREQSIGVKLSMVSRFSLECGTFTVFKRSYFFIINDKTSNESHYFL